MNMLQIGMREAIMIDKFALAVHMIVIIIIIIKFF